MKQTVDRVTPRPAGWTEQEWNRLVDALTRREVVGASLVSILLNPDAIGALGTPVGDGFREITDAMGPVTVPTNPQRVIANGSATLGNMLALGFKPVGSDVNLNSLPFYLADLMEGVEDVTSEDGLDIEKALALQPDLIVALWGVRGTGHWEENVLRYKQAVATFGYEQNYVYEEDIKQNVREVAYALNVEAKADEVLAMWDSRIAALKERVSEIGFESKPLTVVRVFRDGTYSVRIGTSESIVSRALGIPQPEGQQNPEDFALELSLERLDMLNESWAVLVYIDDNSDVTDESLLENEVWQLLTPVQEGRIVFVNSGIWNSIDMLGAMAILDDVENLVLPLADTAS